MPRKTKTVKRDAPPAPRANGVVIPNVGRRAFYVNDKHGR
jgi:hypothetical protein